MKQLKDCRVYGFGVGNDCDRELVNVCSKKGKGVAYFSADKDIDSLRALVIDALQKASEPCLEDCSLELKVNKVDGQYDNDTMIKTNQTINLGTLSRHQLVQHFFVIKKEHFESNDFTIKFKTGKNPLVDGPQSIEFQKADFINFDKNIDDNHEFSLSKLAAK